MTTKKKGSDMTQRCVSCARQTVPYRIVPGTIKKVWCGPGHYTTKARYECQECWEHTLQLSIEEAVGQARKLASAMRVAGIPESEIREEEMVALAGIPDLRGLELA